MVQTSERAKFQGINNDTIFVVTFDNDTRVRDAKPAFQSLVKETNDELKHRTRTNIVGEVPKAVLDEIDNAVRNESPWRGVLPIRVAEGRTAWFEVFVRGTYRRGKVTGAQWLMTYAPNALASKAEKIYQSGSLNRRVSMQTVLGAIAGLILIFASAMINWWAVIPTGLAFLITYYLLSPGRKYAEQLNALEGEHAPIQQRIYADSSTLGALLYELMLKDSAMTAVISRLDNGTEALAETLSSTRQRSEHTLDMSQQAVAAIEQVATAMEEMSMTVADIATNASESSSSAEDARNTVNHAAEFISNTSDKMSYLVKQVSASANTTEDLVERSEMVRTVSQQIDSIAEQTNLLALNAAIEAARAGESGRGFSVVADEVRNLSKRTQQAVDEIDETITGMAGAIEKWDRQMAEQRELAEECGELGQQSKNEMVSIQDAITDISDRMTQIATAAEEHSQAVGEVRNGINQVNDTSKETHEVAIANAEDVQSVSRRVTEFRSLVAAFEDDDD
ncbi:methyl-accepting chemotaxis protein [Idiomarina sp.]|uniref:methyl-accepting chemotaxis protein n=1 Tax=Idiomarina sp. TaxID=1874361 RepID=UPI003A8FA3F8